MAEPMGFFTDTTVCIGCKACEVACKEWNQLPATNGGANTLSGDSYDNTRRLDGEHWRHVKFVEQFSPDRQQARWLMMSDVCKHCAQAACLEVCPLVDKPEVYGLPAQPKLPTRNLVPASLFSMVGAGLIGLFGFLSFRKSRMDEAAASTSPLPLGEG